MVDAVDVGAASVVYKRAKAGTRLDQHRHLPDQVTGCRGCTPATGSNRAEADSRRAPRSDLPARVLGGARGGRPCARVTTASQRRRIPLAAIACAACRLSRPSVTQELGITVCHLSLSLVIRHQQHWPRSNSKSRFRCLIRSALRPALQPGIPPLIYGQSNIPSPPFLAETLYSTRQTSHWALQPRAGEAWPRAVCCLSVWLLRAHRSWSAAQVAESAIPTNVGARGQYAYHQDIDSHCAYGVCRRR